MAWMDGWMATPVSFAFDKPPFDSAFVLLLDGHPKEDESCMDGSIASSRLQHVSS